MFKLPSLQFEYHMVYSGDPALMAPEIPADAPDREARETEWLRQLKTARESGRWDSITKPGEQPTLWRMRSIHAELSDIEGERERAGLTHAQWCELALRYALVGVDNLGASTANWKLQTESDDKGRQRVALKSIGEIKALGYGTAEPMLGHAIIIELGGIALKRAFEGGISPLS